MRKFDTRFSRRALMRGTVFAGIGATGLALVGCGDDDDADDTASATNTPSGEGNGGSGEAQELKLVSGWYKGEDVEYYDFGMNTKLASGASVATAPIYVFIKGMKADGTPDFVQGQHNIITVVPGDAGYSDLWQVNMVTVPASYTADSLKSKAEIDDGGFEVQAVDMFVNCPVVPEGTTLEGGEPLVQGWKGGEAVFYPDFGMNPPAAIPIWVFISGMDSSGMPQFVEGQRNIIDAVPGDAGYSAFWQVNMVTVPDSYEANTVKSADEVREMDLEVTETRMLVNCPVVS
jgi:hypothetical protein